jgi:hypothetical protein
METPSRPGRNLTAPTSERLHEAVGLPTLARRLSEEAAGPLPPKPPNSTRSKTSGARPGYLWAARYRHKSGPWGRRGCLIRPPSVRQDMHRRWGQPSAAVAAFGGRWQRQKRGDRPPFSGRDGEAAATTMAAQRAREERLPSAYLRITDEARGSEQLMEFMGGSTFFTLPVS